MRGARTVEEHPAVGLIPTVVADQADDVIEVRTEPEYRLHVRFGDGTEGMVDLHLLIHSPTAGVFAGLADPVLFAQVRVELGAVTWPGGVDLAPDAVYAALRQSGTWVIA